MGRLMQALVMAVLTLGWVWAQTNQPPESPKQVVEKYLKMVADGALLTPEGWDSVNSLLATPSPQPKDATVFVNSTHCGVGENWVKDDRAEVQDEWWEPLGSIDSSLRYTPPPSTNAVGNIGVYHLLLTDKHWVRGADGIAKEVPGPLQWKMEGPMTRRWTTVKAAIQYVEQLRNKSSDPKVKQNADETIKKLRAHEKLANCGQQ